jgi:hypothetical protein
VTANVWENHIKDRIRGAVYGMRKESLRILLHDMSPGNRSTARSEHDHACGQNKRVVNIS